MQDVYERLKKIEDRLEGVEELELPGIPGLRRLEHNSVYAIRLPDNLTDQQHSLVMKNLSRFWRMYGIGFIPVATGCDLIEPPNEAK